MGQLFHRPAAERRLRPLVVLMLLLLLPSEGECMNSTFGGSVHNLQLGSESNV